VRGACSAIGDGRRRAGVSTPSHDRVERGARLVGAGILVSRLLGLVRMRVFAHYFGSSMQADAYNAALRIPNLVRNLLGEGAISASFVPVYAAALERGDKEGARALANALLGVLLAGVALITIAGIAAAPILTAVFASGFDGERAALTTKLMRALFPMTGLMVLSGWCLGVQNAHRRFFIAYASAAMWSVTQIALLLAAGPRTPDLTTLVWWLSWATLAGAVLQIATQMPQVTRLIVSIRPTLNTSVPGVRETLVNFVPVVSALGLFQISSMVDLEIASHLSVGAASVLNYAGQLYLLPLSLFGIATAAAALPEMARAHAAGQSHHIGDGVAHAWERVLFYTIPSAVAFIGIGDFIVALMYEGGLFDSLQRVIVHIVLAAYAMGLVAYASSRLLSSVYQAVQNYRMPMIAAGWGIGVSAVVALAVSLPFRDRLVAVAGIAIGSAVGAHVNLFMLWRGIQPQFGPVDMRGPRSVALRTLGVACAAVVPTLAFRLVADRASIHLLAVGAILVYCLTFVVLARAAGLSEANRMVAALMRRIGKR
jgi:putative peptidoglycan lipid II flippase